MHFKDEKHRALFTEVTGKLDSKNHALLSAVYLLTAERRLWHSAEPCVTRNTICFERLRLKGCTESEYALCCAAKDLYLGTKNLTIADLADNAVIEPQTFRLICAAMTIRRHGVDIEKEGEEHKP